MLPNPCILGGPQQRGQNFQAPSGGGGESRTRTEETAPPWGSCVRVRQGDAVSTAARPYCGIPSATGPFCCAWCSALVNSFPEGGLSFAFLLLVVQRLTWTEWPRRRLPWLSAPVWPPTASSSRPEWSLPFALGWAPEKKHNAPRRIIECGASQCWSARTDCAGVALRAAVSDDA